MGAPGLPLAVTRLRPQRRLRVDRHLIAMIAVIGGTLVWTAAVALGLTGESARLAVRLDEILALGPALGLLLVLLSRPHSPTYLKIALGWMVTVLAGYESLSIVGTQLDLAAAPLALAAATVFALARPASALALPFLIGGFFGTLGAHFTSPAPLADVFLGGVWLAMAWQVLTGRRRFPGTFPAVLVVIGIYLVGSLVYAIVDEPLYNNLYGFRWGPWYLSALFLTAYWVQDRPTLERAWKAVLAVCALVMAYTMLRWAIGPSDPERELAAHARGYALDATGKLRLFGSLPGPTALSVWAAAVCPFAMAVALTPGRRLWRAIGLFTSLAAAAALFGADTRISIVGAALGLAIVFILFALGPAFSGRRVLPLVTAGAMALSLGTAFVVDRLDPTDPSNQRFRGLLNPSNDLSWQARTEKWKEILADINQHPFGHGLDASGSALVKARFVTAAKFDPDSGYVKIAYDQGILVLIIYVAGLAIIVVELIRRALTTQDIQAAMLATGAAGTLAGFMVALNAGIFQETPTALAPWVITGLGLAAYINAQPRAPASERSAQ